MISIKSNQIHGSVLRAFACANSTLTKLFEQLSSGQRITSASDDPAGLSVASTLACDVRIYSQAVRNLNDGVSALNVGQAALTSLQTITTRQLELAEQAANGTYSRQQRLALNAEANALAREFNRIVQSTTFNGRALFDDSAGILQLQGGRGTEAVIAVDSASSVTRTTGSGLFQTAQTYSGSTGFSIRLADFNNDSRLDAVVPSGMGTSLAIYTGNGDGSFLKATSFQSYGFFNNGVACGDLDGNGTTDLVVTDAYDTSAFSVLLGNGNGTFKAAITCESGSGTFWTELADFNGDRILDVAATERDSNAIMIAVGNGNGTFRTPTRYAAGADPAYCNVGDVNGDNFIDVVSVDLDGECLSVFLNNGDGSLKARRVVQLDDSPNGAAIADMNHDGYIDLVAGVGSNVSPHLSVILGNGDGTFRGGISYATGQEPSLPIAGDINGDGIVDVVTCDYTSRQLSVFLGNGDGTLGLRSVLATPGTLPAACVGDLNGDGALDISALSSGSLKTFLATPRQTATMAYVDLTTQQRARESMTAIREMEGRVLKQLAAIGAGLSRLDAAGRVIQSARENSSAALSRVADFDVADGSARLARTQILGQAAVSLLAQANQIPALALRLLQGA